MAPDLRPLRRHRDYRLLTLGQSVSFFGSMVTYVAVPYQVYELTGSSLAVGLVGVVQMAAILALAFLGGALADAADRRRLVRWAEAGELACCLALLGNAALDRPQVWLVFVLAGAMSGLNAIQRPALQGLVPRIVDRDELTAAGAIDALTRTVGMIAGPAFAGVLLAGPGLEVAYAVDAATFAVSLVALSLMRAVPPPPEAERPSLRRVVEGLRYARSRPELIGTYLDRHGGHVLRDADGPVPGPGRALRRLGGPRGALRRPVGRRLPGHRDQRLDGPGHRHGRAITIAAALWGLAIVGFGLAPWLWLALLGLAAAGAADMVSGIFRMSMWNRTIPDHLRGRLASIEMLSYTSGPLLGNAEAGAAASLVGVRASPWSPAASCAWWPWRPPPRPSRPSGPTMPGRDPHDCPRRTASPGEGDALLP